MASDPNAQVLADDGTLSPLPADVKKGIIAMGFCGLLSFVSCGLLFFYISYRLLMIRSSRNNRRRVRNSDEQEDVANLAVRANGKHSPTDLRTLTQNSDPQGTEETRSQRLYSNSFLTLIHNLLVADMLQALAFLFNLTWWRADGIFVSSGLCGAQAFFVMLGSVSISAFLAAISINTFLTIVWGLKSSRSTTRSVVAFNWILAFILAFAGFGINIHTLAGHEGPFYARSVSLCWISHVYVPTFGMWLQNFWLVLAMAITIVCYSWIFIALMRNRQSPRDMPPMTRQNGHRELSGHHPAFLIYPAIYIITTAPLTLVGLLSISGNIRVSTQYFSLVSGISSLAGLLDAMLWSTTILLSSSEDLKKVGLDKYEFMRTPSREYGNIVWVEGAARNQSDRRTGGHCERRWWRLHSDTNNSRGANGHRIDDEDNVQGIQLDTVTSVQVEQGADSGLTVPSGSPSFKIPKAYYPAW